MPVYTKKELDSFQKKAQKLEEKYDKVCEEIEEFAKSIDAKRMAKRKIQHRFYGPDVRFAWEMKEIAATLRGVSDFFGIKAAAKARKIAEGLEEEEESKPAKKKIVKRKVTKKKKAAPKKKKKKKKAKKK